MSIDELIAIMAMLRDPDNGCPWDRQQDFRSIAPHTLEEAFEVTEVIEQGDLAHLPNELGDLLFQVIFYAQLGREQGLFDFNDIVDEICTKLLRRHPHVFPAATMESFGQAGKVSSEQVAHKWEQLKREERREKRGASSVLDDIPVALPALTRARKLQKRAATVGFDWQNTEDVLAKVREEIGELASALSARDEENISEELGDLFFSLVNLSRHLARDPESCLRAASRKFEKRFRQLESRVAADEKALHDLSLDELEQYWQDVKKHVE